MPIKVSCSHCGRPHTLADKLAGKRVRCKECEKPFAVPEDEDDDTDVEDKRVKAARPRRDREDDEDDDREEEERRPSVRRGRRRKSKGGIPVWVWLVSGAAALLLFLGAGVLGVLFVLGGFGSVSAANFAKLQEGMSPSEVKRILGWPDSDKDIEPRNFMGQKLPDEGHTYRGCEWKQNGRYEIFAGFEDNRLVLAGGTIEGKPVLLTKLGNFRPPQNPQPPAQPPRPQPAVQPPNRPPNPNPGAEFGIHIGMTEAELIAKLGPPDQTKDEPDKRSLRWFKGKRVIDATLIGGKATGMGFSWR